MRENLLALASQDYPDYELIVAVRDAADLPDGARPDRARLVVAGPGDPATGQKINNLSAAVAAARPESAILAFADSDGRPQPGWLRSLAAPLAEPGVGAATGYRWYTPIPPDFWSTFRGVWNAAIAGTFGPGDNSFCWGGAMAIRRETFERARVPEFWRGRISDDYQMTLAIRAAGLKIQFAPGAVVPCLDHNRAAEFFSWIQRQMIITRVYAPRLWRLAFIAHIIYCGGMVGAALISPWALALVLALGVLKACTRARRFHAILPNLPNQSLAHAVLVTFATWVWLGSLLASATTRTVVWRGVRYELMP